MMTASDKRAPRTAAGSAEAVDGRGHAAHAAPLSQVAASGVAVEDWDILFSAVRARLRRVLSEAVEATPGPGLLDSTARQPAGLLECVEALDQLHTTMTHELGRRRQLERELLGSQIAQARDRPRREALAVLHLDLDGFKTIHDLHGQDTGDALLDIIAARLTRTVRAEDVVNRLEGGGFACLLTGLPGGQRPWQLACKLFDAVSAPVRLGELELSVRPSIGIAMCPDDGTTAEELLGNAGAAMRRAGREQTGYAFFDDRLDVRAVPAHDAG